MEVTKSNFKDVFPIIKEAISKADFFAIDTELTGLKVEEKEHAFDTMDERYLKQCVISKDFLIIQFGLSCFQYYNESKKYKHKDFNFYIFPQQHCKQAPDAFFTCQASSLHYLISQGFDFNKLLNEGLSYLSPSQERELRSTLEEEHLREKETFSNQKNSVHGDNSARNIQVPDEHKEFVFNTMAKVDAFMANEQEILLKLSPCSRYHRKLLYDSVQHKYPIGIDMSTARNENQSNASITISKMTKEQKLKNLQLKHDAEMDNLDDAVGFRKVLDLITESKKLVLGHNMMLDVLHTVNQFYYPLPETLTEFKDIVKCVFPRIADTKNIATSSHLKEKIESSALFDLWRDIQMKPAPVVEPDDDGHCYSTDMNKQHEAGYDAFITGMCFVKLFALLAQDKSLNFIPIESKLFSPYINRIYVMRHFDVHSLHLSGPDPEPKRDHVYFVTFPKQWRTDDINQLFTNYGNIFISWLNNSSALVALKSPEQAVNVKRTLLKDRNSIYRVLPYSDYLDMQKPAHPALAVEQNNVVEAVCDSDLISKKRRSSSGSIEGLLTNRAISPIPEVDEDAEDNTTEKQDDCVSTSYDLKNSNSSSGLPPRAKKQKTVHEDVETHEVTSTDKLFQESDEW